MADRVIDLRAYNADVGYICAYISAAEPVEP